MKCILEVFILVLMFLNAVHGAPSLGRTFSFGVSQYPVTAGKTYSLWNYSGAGVVQYLWTACDCGMQYSFFIDGAKTPNYVFSMNHLAGIGYDDDYAPWGNSLFGKGAAGQGGVYANIRIPFFTSISVKVSTPATIGPVQLYWQIRGSPNLPIVVGGVTLPSSAKLVQYRHEPITLNPLQFVDLVNTTNAGVVFMTFMELQSSNENFMEGCFRTYHGNSPAPELISTGMEDYFQSAYYFDAGQFHFPNAGLSHAYDKNGQFAAYRVHQEDPIFFESGGFRFVFRNGDTVDRKTNLKCTDDQGSLAGNPQKSSGTILTWTYEW